MNLTAITGSRELILASVEEACEDLGIDATVARSVAKGTLAGVNSILDQLIKEARGRGGLAGITRAEIITQVKDHLS